MASTQTIRRGLSHATMSEGRLAFLAKLPFFLNSSLKLQRIVHIALEHILVELKSELAVLYLLDSSEEKLGYWALKGENRERLEGTSSVADNHAVELVTQNSFPLVMSDSSDFPSIGLDPIFGTELKNMFCMPLLVRGESCVGALQIVNTSEGEGFSPDDIAFIEQFSHQVALAIDNARLFQAAERHREQLRALDRRKSETISVIAHEFRTPLNIIQNASELLGSKAITEDNKDEMFNLLHSSVERLTRLIAQIRNVSLVQDTGLQLHAELVDISELCRSVVGKYAEAISKRNLAFEVTVPKVPLVVKGEQSLLLIVLQNLISNAIRFTPDGGTIWLIAELDKGQVQVSVKDTGIGIPENELQLIFEKFYEVQDSMYHSSGDYEFRSSGLGLGLAAVRHILEAHNSAVEVESAPDGGSVFRFRLPPG